ncbi:XdhC family protein [Niveibacterium sp. SC-1]|uniref:XdhC family protein n=1 Tax=Niveibacterium sp. SC-1 TaxID=3135646 RepID=UPI0031202C33
MDAVDLDVLRDAARWLEAGHGTVLVTVLRTWGSSPRPPGALMALRDDGRVSGSVSGGCIEDALIGDIHEAGLEALTPAGLPRLRRFGGDADSAQRFGLPCGGSLELVLEPLGPASRIPELVARLAARELVRRELDLATGQIRIGPAAAREEFRFDARRLIAVMGPRYRLLVIGAGQLSRYLCETALGLGFDITVCDPRDSYADNWHLSGVELTRAMPDDVVQVMKLDERSAVVALTHDPKLDDLAILDALHTPAFYVGALGSRANNAARRARLREHFGLAEAVLERLRGPAGLYIGSRTPPEIALSILAEIIAVRNGVRLPPQMDVGEAKNAQPGLAPSAVCGDVLA